MKKRIIPLLFIFFSAFTYSCTKVQTAGTGIMTYTGAISGHVDLYDQYGSKVETGLGNVALAVNGGVAINPDAIGYYIFGNITTGDYNIYTTASGYATTQTNNFQFLADTLNKDIKLSAIPNFSPISYAVYNSFSTPGDSVVLTFSADTRSRNCILFINTSDTVNGQPTNYVLEYVKNIPANKTSVFIEIPTQDIVDAGLTGGSTIYCGAYGYVITDVSVFEDITTGKNVYNAISSAPLLFTATAP